MVKKSVCLLFKGKRMVNRSHSRPPADTCITIRADGGGSPDASRKIPLPAPIVRWRAILAALVFTGCTAWSAGCGTRILGDSAGLFTVPLEVEGIPAGSAILDTGGAYELLLRRDFGLPVVGEVEILTFAGRERVRLTSGFNYSAGGIKTVSDGAIVGLSICDCNGLGFKFFRKTGVVLGLDFPSAAAAFFLSLPESGVVLPFEPPPPQLERFDSAFIKVRVRFGERDVAALGLLDTGAAATLLRRDVLGISALPPGNRVTVVVAQERLGAASVQVATYESQELPDLIIGTDLMRAWGDRWYFAFADSGGEVVVLPGEGQVDGDAAVLAATRRLETGRFPPTISPHAEWTIRDKPVGWRTDRLRPETP